MRLRRLVVAAALCGTAAAGWLVLARFDVDSFHAAAAPVEPAPASATAEVAPVDAAKTDDAVSRDRSAKVDATVPASLPAPQSASPPAAPIPMPDAAPSGAQEPAPSSAQQTATSVEAFDEWVLSESGMDQYLWSVYQRTPKLDTVKVSERVKVTVKSKGKTRTVTKNVAKLVDEDFAWKDPKAADKVGMSLMEYVIGGMDPSFRLRLYRLLRAMDDAGLEPGITSAFRDDYRQSLASGKKAATDRSYHGGSLRGGYGHGLAADLVSVKGETRAQRQISSGILWQWIDAHGREFGIARPYLNRDPPHVGPLDGQEYADKRGRYMAKVAQKRHGPAENSHGKTDDGKTASR